MHKKSLYFIIVIILIVFGIVYFTGNSRMKEDLGYSFETVCETENTVPDTNDNYIYVYICGSVLKPGVYGLTAGSRICDVINLAGGVSDDADIDVINQAEKISDGQKIYVPSYGESVQQSEINNGLININTADIAVLTSLPGIGEARAEAIISYRNSSGGFSKIEDIMNVNGIKEAAFNKIKDYICV